MATAKVTTAPTTTTRTQETNFNNRTCVSDLTKIPQNEFEAQFRNWMEKDGVARSMQAKLRADLIANFNKTNLGKHMLGQTTTNRLTLSPMELALNTLVAEFLFSQDCHFTLSVYSTEAPFRNTLPDLEGSTNFRFNATEITEIVKAICDSTNYDWNLNNKIIKNYESNRKTALLHYILKALLENNAETAHKKVTVGTNTRPLKMPSLVQPQISSDIDSSQLPRVDSKTEFYNSNFRYLNRYLIILSRKVKDMSEQFEKLQNKRGTSSVPCQPRVRVLKSPSRRKYEDLNRSLERVTENLKQMANAKRKSKRVGTIVKAIETLSMQFQKCAENFENVSKDLRSSARSSLAHTTKVDKSTSAESIKPSTRHHFSSPTTAAASQTDVQVEKSFSEWLHEMRYTRNGQRFLDRVEKSFLKALERQKRELATQNEIKLRHQRELLKIRYKQKVIEQMYTNGNQSANKNEPALMNAETNETISEQFRQFEIKHFDLLSRIYESEAENRATGSRINKETSQRIAPTEKLVQFNVKENEPLPKSDIDMRSTDLKLTSSSECLEQPQQCRQVLKERNTNSLQQQVREAIVEMVSEERNVDQIVLDAKLRIKELEHESNQLTENFLGYLERQREQKLAAREAAQSLWNDYMNEREKMQKRYSSKDEGEIILADIEQTSQSKELGDVQSKQGDMRETLELFLSEHKKREKIVKASKMQEISETIKTLIEVHHSDSSGDSSGSYIDFKNPIIQAKQEFFERERKFKAEAEDVLNRKPNLKMDLKEFLSLGNNENFNVNATSTAYPIEMTYELEPIMPPINKKPQQLMITNSLMAQFLSDSLSGTNTDLSTTNQAIERTTEMSATSNFQLAANWQSSLKEPQFGNVNNSQQREIIATAARREEIRGIKNQKPTTITTNTIVATTKTTLPSALNKNKTDGASITEAQQENSNGYKIKSDAAGFGGQENKKTMEQQQQSEWNNNSNNINNSNKTNNIKSNGMAAIRAFVTEKTVSTIQTSKLPSSNSEVVHASSGELSRKAILKQTMARMQQLFLPHQQTTQLNHKQQQQIMLADVAEEVEKVEDEDEVDEDDESESTSMKKQQTKLREPREAANETRSIHNNNNNNNSTTNTSSQHDVGGGGDASNENVLGYYKNNLQLKQITTTTKITKCPSKEQQKNTEIPAKSMRNIDEQREATTSAAAAAAAAANKTTLHSIEGNKIAEASTDWQQIACGPSGRVNEAKVNAAKVKKTAEKVTSIIKENIYDNEYDDDDDDEDDQFEMDIKDTMFAVKEPGEVVEVKQPPPPPPPPITLNQLEIGELIEHSDDVSIRTPNVSRSDSSASAVSSIDLQLSVGGARQRSYGGRSSVIGVGNGSDTGSDFWA